MDNTQDQPEFTPIRRRRRHDGRTAERQMAFIEAFAATGCISDAARAVGMSASSAYQLRRQLDGGAFRQAIDAALDCGLAQLADRALGRAMHGVPRPIFHQGEQVGEWRHFDERLTMFLLRTGNPTRFGNWVGRQLTSRPPEGPDMVLTARLAKLDLRLLAEELAKGPEWAEDEQPDDEPGEEHC
jgi:hypothetical protein